MSKEQNTNFMNPYRLAKARAQRIRALNDRLRQRGEGGAILITSGIEALGELAVGRILKAVASITFFGATDDLGELHERGSLMVDGHAIVWVIDYFERSYRIASPDPADPTVTARVLTVMLADEV